MGCGCLWLEGRHRAPSLLAAAIDEDVLRYRFVKKKGYVRLHTSKGDLNLEPHCDMVGVAAGPSPAQSSFQGLKTRSSTQDGLAVENQYVL